MKKKSGWVIAQGAVGRLSTELEMLTTVNSNNHCNLLKYIENRSSEAELKIRTTIITIAE